MSGVPHIIWLLLALPAQAPVFPQTDPFGDARIRRTDLGADGIVGELMHVIPDIAGYGMGNWQPANPSADLFTGTWSPQGVFLRIDIGFFGHVNPPGPLDLLPNSVYDPYRYGNNPAFGYIELDLDHNVASGGEWDRPDLRYLWNVARFGGLPSVPRFLTTNRIATNWTQLDHILSTPPYVERSGEEFHIALFGDWIEYKTELSGNGDNTFDPGEVWLVHGRLFHRAHVFKYFSGANGNGEYLPRVDLRFDHPVGANITMVSLVYPLTNAASAMQYGTPNVEPMDGSDSNQNSVEEALADLTMTVQQMPPYQRDDPRFPMIAPWEDEDAGDYLNSTYYQVDMLVGMAYTTEKPDGAVVAWTDAWPGPIFGDFNGDGRVNATDVQLFDGFISQYDAADGVTDGRVQIPGFAQNYSMFDLNYNGVVDDADRMLIRVSGDLNGDFLVDEADVALLVWALLHPGMMPANVPPDFSDRADFNHDGILNGRDIPGMVRAYLLG